MASFFNESQYLSNKVKQLAAAGEKDANGNAYTADTVKAAMAASGMSPEEHYSAFGRGEKLNPNAYFNESEYLSAKLKALQETEPEWAGKSTADVAKAMAEAGMTPAEHYETIGAFETTKDGSLLNPSNAFDANAYFSAKLEQLIETGHPGATEMTVAELVNIVKSAGFSPVSHYVECGATETASGVPLVQTVPVVQRVENDPNRAVLGDNVPSNFNPATPGATTAEAKPAPVTKPADVGGMADKTVSPDVKIPSAPVKTPADQGYVAPPDNIKDTNDKPVVIVPDKDGGSFGVLDPSTGNVNGIKPDGSVSEDVIGKDDGSGTITPPVTPPVTPPTPPSGGGGGGGGGDDDNPLLTHSFTNNDLQITCSGISADEFTVGFKSGDGSGEINMDINITNESPTLKVSKDLLDQDVTGIKTLDLSELRIAHDKFVTIDLTTNAPDTLALVKGTTSQKGDGDADPVGGDIIKVKADQVKSGGKFAGTSVAAGIQADLGDDILVVEGTISANYTFGYVDGIETVVNTIDASGTFAIDYTQIDADMNEDLTAMLKAASGTGGTITTKGVGELMLDNLKLAKLDMDITGATFAQNDPAVIEGVGLEIGNFVVTGAGSDKSTVLDLKLGDANTITISGAGSLTGITSVAISDFEQGDLPIPGNILNMTRTDASDESLTLKIGSADLLKGASSPVAFNTVDASGTSTYKGTFKMEIGYSGSGTGADLSNVHGLDEIDLKAIEGTVTVDTNVYKGAEADKGLTIYSSTADTTITLTDHTSNYKDTIVLNSEGTDTITGFEIDTDKIDLKTTLKVAGYNEGTAGNKIALSGALNICSASGSGALDSSAAKSAIDTAFTSGTDSSLKTGTVFAIHYTDSSAPTDGPETTTLIWYFKDSASDGLTADSELTLIGEASNSLDYGDFIVGSVQTP